MILTTQKTSPLPRYPFWPQFTYFYLPFPFLFLLFSYLPLKSLPSLYHPLIHSSFSSFLPSASILYFFSPSFFFSAQTPSTLEVFLYIKFSLSFNQTESLHASRPPSSSSWTPLCPFLMLYLSMYILLFLFLVRFS
jgi:hypothetical protein